jgi:hypothetical protein
MMRNPFRRRPAMTAAEARAACSRAAKELDEMAGYLSLQRAALESLGRTERRKGEAAMRRAERAHAKATQTYLKLIADLRAVEGEAA